MTWADSLDRMDGSGRRLCKICYDPIAISFHVPDEVWAEIVPPEFHEQAVCLNCFVRLADATLYPWERAITFRPVSLATQIIETLFAGAESEVESGAFQVVRGEIDLHREASRLRTIANDLAGILPLASRAYADTLHRIADRLERENA